MADTPLNSFGDGVIADDDILIVQTAAGGGKNPRGLRLVKRDANGNVAGALRVTGSYLAAGAAVATSGVGGHVRLYDDTAALRWLAGMNGVAGQTSYQIYDLFAGAERFAVDSDGTIRPGSDNAQSFGKPGYRVSVIYAATGAISTSDANDKQQVEPIPDLWLDAWGDVEWSRFKFNDAVGEKGAEDARWHCGLVAQQVRDAFAARGLDAAAIGLIGLLCRDTWAAEAAVDEVRDEDGAVIVPARPAAPAGERWGLRYEECFAIEAAYQRRRMAAIESRLAALEGGGA